MGMMNPVFLGFNIYYDSLLLSRLITGEGYVSVITILITWEYMSDIFPLFNLKQSVTDFAVFKDNNDLKINN